MFRSGDYLCLGDFEVAARRRLPRRIFQCIEGGAEDGVSLRGNRAAFADYALQTRVLVDSSARSCTVNLFGRPWAAPFGIAPMGAMGLAAFQADLVLARAAAKANIPFVLSGSALMPMERVIQANPEAWFQAYLSADAQENERLVQRVEASGFRTLVITTDVPVSGNREQDVRNGYTSPLRPSAGLALDGMLHPHWLAGTFLRTLWREGMPHFENFAMARVPMISLRATRPHKRDNLRWDDLRRLRDRWSHRLVLKGVLSAADAALARQSGMDAVIASNHGGRQLDGAVSPLHMLRDIHQQSETLPVLYDGGVRRGTDVLKAMALGAAHVFLGRPFLYAVVAGGELGALRAIELLKTEILRDMALLGRVSLSSDLSGMLVCG
jgi:L-lactate dehydrogenase (cytochrome)